ncbi:hypothetical protein PR048_012939 [Dryococelus australis]|uniref:Peptidase A2 domain-containing protein n=1 Tax=Dryococelus australis TaxID=614101 RepID=A0ABQ9HQQ8_9NEOP|nr:hypothetical protein PR048_012939 [Dryococelus australis]
MHQRVLCMHLQLNNKVITTGRCRERVNSHKTSSETVSVKQAARSINSPPVYKLGVEGKVIRFAVDSGARISVLLTETYDKLFPHKQLKNCDRALMSVTGEKLSLLDKFRCQVKLPNKERCKLKLVVCYEQAKQGRHMDTEAKNTDLEHELLMVRVESQPNMGDWKSRHPHVFASCPKDCIKGFKANLFVNEDATPVFYKSYSVPYALKENSIIEGILKRLPGVSCYLNDLLIAETCGRM